MNISDNIASFIVGVGLKQVFGISGVPNLYLLNSIEKSGIRFIQGIHESNSVLCAGGDYLNTGNVNFVIVTAGPGLTNSLNGLSNLYIDNIPVILISINNNTNDYGLGNHHDSSGSSGIDIINMAKGCTCFSEIATSENNLMGILSRAYYKAKMESKPVHISIPMNVLDKNIQKKYKYDFFKTINSIDKLEKKINILKKPLFIFSDLTYLYENLLTFINENNFYFCLTSSNKKIYSNKNFLGYIDYINQLKINKTILLFDEIILIGNGFNKFYLENVSKYIFDKKIIHFGDIVDKNIFGIYENYEFNKINSIKNLLDIKFPDYYTSFLSSVITQIDLKQKNDYKNDKYYLVYKYLNKELLDNESLFISGGTTTKLGFLFFRPNSKNIGVHYTGNFFTLGSSIISIGYALNSNNRVYALVGDGDFLMNWNELLIAFNNNIDITVILFNNGGYKSLKHTFEIKYGVDYHNDKTFESINTSFKGISNTLGCNYFLLENVNNIEELFSSLPEKGVNLVEIKI